MRRHGRPRRPKPRRQGLHLLVTPDTILRWHCGIVRQVSNRGPAAPAKTALRKPDPPRNTDRPAGRSRLPPRIVWSVYLSGSRDTLFSRLFERSNTSRSCHRPGAKMGSHPAKSRQESGGVWTVICPGKQRFANLLDSSRPARGLLHTEEVTGSIPVSPTQPTGRL